MHLNGDCYAWCRSFVWRSVTAARMTTAGDFYREPAHNGGAITRAAYKSCNVRCLCVCVTVEKKPHLLWCNQQPGFSEYSRLTSPLTLPKWCPVTVSVNLPVPYSYCPLFAIINSPAGQTSLWSGVTGKSGPAVWGWSRGHSRGRGGGGSGSELSPCGWGRPQRRGSLRSRELPVLI